MKKQRVPPWATVSPALSVKPWVSLPYEGKLLCLAKIQAFQLGFKQKARYSEICYRAQGTGLSLCPRMVHFEIVKLHDLKIPVDEVVHIAAEPDGTGQPGFITTLRQFGTRIAHGPVMCDDATFFVPRNWFAFVIPTVWRSRFKETA